MKDPKVWDIIAWVSFILAIITMIIYFFVDDNYSESPTWLIAAIVSWYYSDHLEKADSNKA